MSTAMFPIQIKKHDVLIPQDGPAIFLVGIWIPSQLFPRLFVALAYVATLFLLYDLLVYHVCV